ncbi:MAG: 23S rRNA (guanosine(2251)-2'-O)-methyltransferase RlmB [Pseudomonadota bacterium]
MSKQQYYLYGLHAVQAALNNPKRKCHGLWATKEALQSLSIPQPLKVKTTQRREIDQLVGANITHQGVALNLEPLPGVYLETYLQACPKQTFCVVLDQVTDPHNIGAILRSATAFGASALIYPEKNAPDGNNNIIAKVASGALEHTPLIIVTNLGRTLETLKQHEFWCTGLDESGQSILQTTPFSQRTAIVLGAEGKGLRRLTRENCDFLVSLPTEEVFPTLNVSNAAAVAFYEYKRQTMQG